MKYPKPYSIYLRGTIGFRAKQFQFQTKAELSNAATSAPLREFGLRSNEIKFTGLMAPHLGCGLQVPGFGPRLWGHSARQLQSVGFSGWGVEFGV